MKLIPILIAIIPLLNAQTVPDARAAYVVTRSTSAESKALFSAKLVKMNATKLHWYENSAVVRVEISSKGVADLQVDPDVELVIADHEQSPVYGPLPAPLPVSPDAKQISCAVPSLPAQTPAVPLTVPPPAVPAIAAPVLPAMPMPMGGGMGMMPGVGNPMITPAFGLADALAGGVVQKLLNRPASCKVSLVNNKATYPGQGGEGLIEVKASGSCAWQAQASVGWITILSGSGVSGNGIISYRVNSGEGLARSASIWILASAGGSPIKGKASQVVTQNK
jgi:hypothetical protein